MPFKREYLSAPVSVDGCFVLGVQIATSVLIGRGERLQMQVESCSSSLNLPLRGGERMGERCVICSCRRDMTWWWTLESHEKRMTTSTGSGDSILQKLAGSYRMETISVRPCETTDHLLFPFSLLGGLVTNSFVWCLVWLMHRHVAACWVTRPTAIHSNPKRWWLLMASLCLRRLYRLHYVVTWPLSCASRNVLGWIYSHVWLCMTV